mmetsp:Transcript_2302/g.2245  ORF Transcript_2302/g.2245 Transcript_2302/m.2245 type:complete len:93 (+) Transcript_2302:2214-2492(+)
MKKEVDELKEKIDNIKGPKRKSSFLQQELRKSRLSFLSPSHSDQRSYEHIHTPEEPSIRQVDVNFISRENEVEENKITENDHDELVDIKVKN